MILNGLVPSQEYTLLKLSDDHMNKKRSIRETHIRSIQSVNKLQIETICT